MRRRVISLILLTAAAIQAPANLFAQGDDGRLVDGLSVGASTGLIVPAQYGDNLLIGHGHGQGRYTAFKGGLGENVMDDFYTRKGEWRRIEPARVQRNPVTGKLMLQRPGGRGNSGLDGVYIRYNKSGIPQRVMVAEAKAFGGQLSKDVTGQKQFSRGYREARLALTAQYYREAANHFESGRVRRTLIPPSMDSRATIQIGRSRSAAVWFDPRSGQWTYYADSGVASSETGRQLKSISQLLQDAADGSVTYRSRLFRFSIGSDDMVSLKTIDPERGLEQKIVRKYSALTPEYRLLIRKSIVRSLAVELESANMMLPRYEAQRQALEMVRHAETRGKLGELVKNYRPSSNYSTLIGVSAGMKSGGLAGLVVGIIELASQNGQKRDLNVNELGSMIALASTSGFLGSWGGSQAQYFLMTESSRHLINQMAAGLNLGVIPGQSARVFAQMAGGVAGGAIASGIFSYGAYALGMMDLRTANRSMIAGTLGGVAGSAFSTGAMGMVGAYGIASTGASIGSLSGAAASNATLAWFGGGSIASGGWGVGTGAAVLGGGAGIVFLGVTGATMYIFHIRDEAANVKRVGRLIDEVHSDINSL